MHTAALPCRAGFPRLAAVRPRRSTHVGAVAAAFPATPEQQQQQQQQQIVELGYRTDFHELYKTREAIGTGSFGQVRMAIHRQSGEKVAAKIMPKVRGKLSRERTLERIAREVGFMQRLQPCPETVRLLGAWEDDHSVQLVTELCRGGDLRKCVERHGALRERDLALVASQVLHFLKACHDQGILYGDVKPANLCLYCEECQLHLPPSLSSASLASSSLSSVSLASAFEPEPGEVRRGGGCRPPLDQLRVVDFGCAQQMTDSRPLSTLVGTFAYMAPECYARHYTLKADMWSLGVTLYWLFSTRFPFWDSGDIPILARTEDMAAAAAHAPISYTAAPWPLMSPQGLDFVQRCLSRDQQQRMSVDEALAHPWILQQQRQPVEEDEEGCRVEPEDLQQEGPGEGL